MTDCHDARLACPTCEYDLRASDGPNCPECGTRFDKERLREWWTVTQRVTPWEREPSIAAFVATWIGVLMWPAKFARRFPPLHDSPRATQFTLICYAIGAVILLLGSAATGTGWIGPLAAGGGLAGVATCEFLLAAVLALLGRPTGIPSTGRRYHLWRGMCHYTSAFAVLSGAWGAAALSLERAFRLWGYWDEILFVAIPGAILIWWWACVAVMVCVRSRGVIRACIGVFSVPICGAIGVFAGYFAAILLVFAGRG
jgi:hypothetical protein